MLAYIRGTTTTTGLMVKAFLLEGVYETGRWVSDTEMEKLNKDVAPYGATFEDGYRAAVICDTILESANTKRQINIKY